MVLGRGRHGGRETLRFPLGLLQLLLEQHPGVAEEGERRLEAHGGARGHHAARRDAHRRLEQSCAGTKQHRHVVGV